MNIKFLEWNNYIGSSEKQKRYTKYIAKYSRNINFISFIHDWLYKILLNLNNPFLFFICSFFADCIFLFGGIFKSLTQINLIKGVIEIIIFIIGFILITVWKPIYIIRRCIK